MQLNQLQRPSGLKRPMERVGRGQSSGRGKQSGRGGKGQTARAGAKIRPAWRDVVKKLPKRRGFGKNRGRTVVSSRPVPHALPLARLEQLFESGATVSVQALRDRGVLERGERAVKIVGGGDLGKKLSVQGIPVSASARAAIEKAGGSIS